MPPNVTSVIQPQDQGIISALKRLYKRNLLRSLINNEEISYEDFVKSIDVYQVMVQLDAAWEAVKESTLRNCWSKLLGKSSDSIEPEFIDFRGLLDQIPGLNYIDDDVLELWLNEDRHDKGFAIYEDEFIVTAVKEGMDPLELLEADEYLEENLPVNSSIAISDTPQTELSKEFVLESIKSSLEWAKANENPNQILISHLSAAISELETPAHA